jgi:alkylhydroperoxidase/carboxymuconolactone decarboxylase family protein YurZ
MTVSLDDVRAAVEELIAPLPDGDPLDALARALVQFGLRICVTTLDVDGAAEWAARALDAGASPEALEEIAVYISGVGMHALIEGTRVLARVLEGRGEPLPERDPEREALWDRYRATGSFWRAFDANVPGFLEPLLRLSPEGFAGFMEFGAIPARTGHAEGLVKELIAVAADATPAHRYLPGLRAHLQNAIRLGAGRIAVLEVLDLAAAMPEHRGIGR